LAGDHEPANPPGPLSKSTAEHVVCRLLGHDTASCADCFFTSAAPTKKRLPAKKASCPSASLECYLAGCSQVSDTGLLGFALSHTTPVSREERDFTPERSFLSWSGALHPHQRALHRVPSSSNVVAGVVVFSAFLQ